MRNLALWVILMGLIAGCGSRQAEPSNAQAAPPLPVGVTASSTPTEVAGVARSLIAAGNQDSFAGLIAAERVVADMAAITKGKSNFEEVRRDAVGLATRTIFRSIVALAGPRVNSESVDGERATCLREGTLNGNTVQRELFFVREGGIWKLVPSHR